jgi:hypothetical protein
MYHLGQRLLYSALITATIAPHAHAVTLLDDLRTLRLEVSGDSDFGGDQTQREYFPADSSDDPFLAWSASDAISSTGAQSATASAEGELISEAVIETRFAASGDVSGVATIFDETGQSAFAGGASVFQVTFELNQETTWRLVAELAASGGTASVSLRQGIGPAGPAVYQFTHATHPTVNELVTLPSGQYTATFEATFAAQMFGPPSLTQSASFNAAMTVVPEPNAILLAVFAALGAVVWSASACHAHSGIPRWACLRHGGSVWR